MTRLLLILAALAAATAGVQSSSASFVQTSGGSATRFVAATDWVAPAIARAAVVPTSPAGAMPGFVRPGATFRIYANVTDPNSGVGSVSADASALGGSSSVTLAASATTIGGVAYTHASAVLTLSSAAAEGTRSFRITARDVAGNSGSAAFTAAVDGTAPTASDVQSTNAGVNGRPDAGDAFTLTTSEPLSAWSIIAGWAGTETAVTVRVVNGSPTDSIQIWDAANTTRLPLGIIDAGKKYVTADVAFTGSRLTLNGAALTVVLGTPSNTAAFPPTPPNGTSTLTWTPGAGLTDRAGNALPATPVLEAGVLDRDF